MSDALKEIYTACNPDVPASDKYYLESSEARGSSNLAKEFIGHLNRTSEPICFLFSGHMGCGKSSELLHLTHELVKCETPQVCFFPVLINVIEYLDEYDVSPTDILLAIVTELANTLRRELNIELQESYFKKQFGKFGIFTEAELKDGEINLGVAKVGIQRLKKDPVARQEVRSALMPKLSTLLEEINLLFEQARLEITKAKSGSNQFNYVELVIILDNLEKIKRLEGVKEGLESQRELFLEHAAKFKGMSAHFIYTVPLRLIRSSDAPQLEHLYCNQLIVLPMIKIIERSSRNPYSKGIETLRKILQKRFGQLELDKAFESDALNFLLDNSGGHVRTLMLFVRQASTYTDKLPINLTAAHKAIQKTVRTYSTSIPEHHWEKLALLDLSDNQRIPNGDDDYRVMLENLSVLEYVNGGDENPYADAEPWYAVNPIVRELQKFKAAVDKIKSETV